MRTKPVESRRAVEPGRVAPAAGVAGAMGGQRHRRGAGEVRESFRRRRAAGAGARFARPDSAGDQLRLSEGERRGDVRVDAAPRERLFVLGEIDGAVDLEHDGAVFRGG